jgi:phage baseplate assembly protein W
MIVNRPVYSYNELTSSYSRQREIGISLQFQTPGVFTSTYTTTQQTKNQLVNYILTDPGERFFNPSFGSGVRGLLFQQDVDLVSLEETLKDGIERNVQNIIVKSVVITTNPKVSNAINININYSINNISDEINVQVNNELTGELI